MQINSIKKKVNLYFTFSGILSCVTFELSCATKKSIIHVSFNFIRVFSMFCSSTTTQNVHIFCFIHYYSFIQPSLSSTWARRHYTYITTCNMILKCKPTTPSTIISNIIQHITKTSKIASHPSSINIIIFLWEILHSYANPDNKHIHKR